MRLLLYITIACLCIGSRAARAEPHTIFLLDVSGSMEYPVAQEKRLDRAKAALLGALSSDNYPGAELIMWNSGKFRDEYGDGERLARQVKAAPNGHNGSYLGSAFLDISDAGYRCAHVVFVTDEYPDDPGNFLQGIERLMQAGWQNTITVYVVKHPESYYHAQRFSEASESTHYRVLDGDRQGSLADYLEATPAMDGCGTLS